MFCKNCGVQLNDEAKFCANCGNVVNSVQASGVTETVKEDILRLELKPTFKFSYKFLGNFFKCFGMVFILFFYIGMELYLFEMFNNAAIIVGLFVFVIVFSILKTFFDKAQYNSLEYNFYNTKIQYRDGFINKEEKELKYRYIREVTMSKSIIERMFGLGTINIFTNASSGGSGGSHGNMNGRNGIHIHCVENVEEEYRKIKQIIDEGIDE